MYVCIKTNNREHQPIWNFRFLDRPILVIIKIYDHTSSVEVIRSLLVKIDILANKSISG